MSKQSSSSSSKGTVEKDNLFQPILELWKEAGLMPTEDGTSCLSIDKNPETFYRLDGILRSLFRWVMKYGKELVKANRMEKWLWDLFRNSAHCVFGVMTCATGIDSLSADHDTLEWDVAKQCAADDAKKIAKFFGMLSGSGLPEGTVGTLCINEFYFKEGSPLKMQKGIEFTNRESFVIAVEQMLTRLKFLLVDGVESMDDEAVQNLVESIGRNFYRNNLKTTRTTSKGSLLCGVPWEVKCRNKDGHVFLVVSKGIDDLLRVTQAIEQRRKEEAIKEREAESDEGDEEEDEEEENEEDDEEEGSWKGSRKELSKKRSRSTVVKNPVQEKYSNQVENTSSSSSSSTASASSLPASKAKPETEKYGESEKDTIGKYTEIAIIKRAQEEGLLIREEDIHYQSIPNGTFLTGILLTFTYLLEQNDVGFVNDDIFYRFIRMGAAENNNRNFAAGLKTWHRRLKGVFGYEEKDISNSNNGGKKKRAKKN